MRSDLPHIDWQLWEALILDRGIVVDRPRGSSHPRYPTMVYPLDYGYIPNTVGGDGAEVDVFAGSVPTGLRAVVITHDKLKDDTEIKLLWNVDRHEIEEVRRFLSDGAMTATTLWRDQQ